MTKYSAGASTGCVVQARQRETIPAKLIFISLPARPDFGVGFEIDNLPGSVFFERQIDHAFQNPVAFELQKNRQFSPAEFRFPRSLEQRMFQSGRDGSTGVFDFLIRRAEYSSMNLR